MTARAITLPARLRRLRSEEEAFGLIELIVAMVLLAVGVGALLTVFVSSALSLQRAGQKGTALTLADTQMEYYRRLPFSGVRLDASLIPASGTYVTANSADSTIPPATNQALAGQTGNDACATGVDEPPACMPVRTITGPDHRQYRIDTYIHYVSGLDNHAASTIEVPASGLTLKRVAIVIRDGADETKILAREQSAFQG